MTRVHRPRHARRRLTFAAAAATALLCAYPGAPGAATRSMSVGEQGAQAELIVRGRVARVEGRWNGDRSTIYSDVAFAVDDTLKGALPAAAVRRREVVFRVLGGEVDGVRMVSSSDALPAVGEELVLFLRSDTAAAARAGSSATAAGGATLALVGQEGGVYAVRSGRVGLHDGREVPVDEFLADVARSAK
jgi:hypothetical protein